MFGEDSTYGDTELYSKRVCLTFRDGSTELGDGEYAPAFDLSKFWNGLQGFDCNDQRALCLAELCDKIGEDRDSQDKLPEITHIPRAQNQTSDFLARTVRFFHKVLYFIGCSISVWLPKPLQV